MRVTDKHGDEYHPAIRGIHHADVVKRNGYGLSMIRSYLFYDRDASLSEGPLSADRLHRQAQILLAHNHRVCQLPTLMV